MVEQKEEAAKNVLFVVLIVIIFVSVLGTWTILTALDEAQRQPQAITNMVIKEGPPASAQVVLDIRPAPSSKISEQKENEGNK